MSIFLFRNRGHRRFNFEGIHKIGWMSVFLIMTLLFRSDVKGKVQSDTSRKGYGRGKIGLFFKRYFDFRNLGSTSRYKRIDPKGDVLAFPFNSEDYSLAFSDDFDTLNLDKWQYGQPWGQVHFQYPHQYYCDSAAIVKNGKLCLLNYYAPKEYRYKDSTYTIPYGVGCINSFYSFSSKYGYFAIRSKNPIGKATWPAFWLTGKYSWPPEIDIFEMYGACNGRDIHKQTMSLHYGSIQGGTKGSLTKSVQLSKDTDSKFHIYSCLWEQKKIRFFTDGILVKTIRLNRWMRKYFNAEMYIIVNNAVDYNRLNCVNILELPQKLEVDWVRVYTK